MKAGRVWRVAFLVCLLGVAVLSEAPSALIKPASAEIPRAAEKKRVMLSREHRDAVRLYSGECGKCHPAPDPAKPAPMKRACTKDLSPETLAGVQMYIADITAGKSLYESRCGRCHTLIDPGAHSADYWSRNLCTSEECFIKNLRTDEEQQVLLYLSAHAKSSEKGE